jgi:Activator of Hsp90 ATPase homolog 1-like protein
MGTYDQNTELETTQTMTKPESVVTQDNDALITEIHIGAPADRVFKALTDEEELARWFTNPSCPVKALANGRPPRRPLWLRH